MTATDAAPLERSEFSNEYDLRRADMWQRTYPTRTLCAGDKDITFDYLSFKTSQDGVLCGARFRETRHLFGRREVLNLTINNDRDIEDQHPASAMMFGWYPNLTGYSVWAYRAGYEPVQLGSANGPDMQCNATAAADIFRDAVATARNCRAGGPLTQTMPKEWFGRHWHTILAEDVVMPKLQGIRITLLFTGLIVPCLLFISRAMPTDHVVALISFLVGASALVTSWLPSHDPNFDIGPWGRWAMRAIGLLSSAAAFVLL